MRLLGRGDLQRSPFERMRSTNRWQRCLRAFWCRARAPNLVSQSAWHGSEGGGMISLMKLPTVFQLIVSIKDATGLHALNSVADVGICRTDIPQDALAG